MEMERHELTISQDSIPVTSLPFKTLRERRIPSTEAAEEDPSPHTERGYDDELGQDAPSDCCSPGCYQRCPVLAGEDGSPFWEGWTQLRTKTYRLIENKYFETAVIIMILLSSLALVSLFCCRESLRRQLAKT